MNSIQVFNNVQFGTIRTTGTADNPQFCLADVCKAVGLTTNGITRRWKSHSTLTPLGKQDYSLWP